MILKHLPSPSSNETFWWGRNSVSALHWVSQLCFPSQLGCKPPEGAKVAFTPKSSMFSPIHLIFRLLAQSGSTAMFSSAFPSKTGTQKKTAGRLCTHFVRDCFHSQQRALEHCWETGLALPGPALPGSRLQLFVNLERVCCHCPREAARSRVLLRQHHLGNSEVVFLRVWWALCSALLVCLPEQPW